MADLKYEDIALEQLNLSVRSYNALKRAGLDTLAELMSAYAKDSLLEIPNLGMKSYEEIKEALAMFDADDFQLVNDLEELSYAEEYEVPKEIENISVYDLKIFAPLRKRLVQNGFDTVGKIVRMTNDDKKCLRGIKIKALDELQIIINKIKEDGEDYFKEEQHKDTYHKRAIDIETAKKLKEDFGLKTIWLAEWYNVSPSRIHQMLGKHRNRGHWIDREMSDVETDLLLYMVENKVWEASTEDGIKAYFVNNGTNDCAVVFVSDMEIKCFFMNMMPETIQEKIKQNRLDCLTMEEFEIISGGKTVSVLKQKCFSPENVLKFRQYAKVRGMNTEEYCKFLTGMEYISPQSSVNDDKIVEFLKANYVNGRLKILNNNSTQWFRSFILNHGYSIEEIADLYGFSEKQQVDDEFLQYENVEEDMQPYSIDSEDWIIKLFAENPLIGNIILSEKTKEKLYTVTKEYIDKRLKDTQIKYSLKAKMLITLAVITYAKEWDSSDDTGFWKYITSQFGYRDDTNQLRSILCDCVKEATLKNRRWFISSVSGYQYKSTIVVHALSTKKSWMRLYDFLFDFYKTNMEWTYIENDPIVARMVTALRSKLIAGEEADEDSLEISTKVYTFQEGIRKLIIYRTGYAIKLIHHMLHRIDSVIGHNEASSKMYVDVLCNQWIEEKLKNAREATSRITDSNVSRSVAIDYTRIRPTYTLNNETDVFISLPDIRLKKTEFHKVELHVYSGEMNIEIRQLSFYGNELGKTLNGFQVNVNRCLAKGDGLLDIRIVLYCDNEKIYDSEDTLYRDFLCFSNSKECDIHDCERGSYSFFTTENSNLEFVRGDVSEIDVITQLKAYYVRLEEEFVVKFNDQIVAFDRDNGASVGNIKTISPITEAGLVFIKNGHRFNVITKETNILLILHDKEELQKCAVIMNSERIDIRCFTQKISGDTYVYSIPLKTTDDKICDYQIIDLNSNKVISRDTIKILDGFSAKFDRDFYYSDKDFIGAYLNVLNFHEEKRYDINSNDELVSFPYADGTVEIKIPRIYIRDHRGQKWNQAYIAWLKDIKHDEKIYLTTPDGCNCIMSLGSVGIVEESRGCFDYGNAAFSYPDGCNPGWIDLVLNVSKDGKKQEYRIGRVSATERFVGEVRFDYHDNTLFWNRGLGFVGNTNGKIKLHIETKNGFIEYPIDIHDDLVIKNPELALNEYRYSIIKESENIFIGKEVILCEGSLFIGDKNELRFKDNIIEITNITYEDGAALRNVEIHKTFIDQIDFMGIQFVDSEDRECPVYKGIMFYMGQSLKHHEFSYEEKLSDEGFLLYKINPVKIVFINDHTLSITNEDGDGLYYYRYYNKYIMDYCYAITDREPTSYNQKSYYLADLYTYRKKRVELNA